MQGLLVEVHEFVVLSLVVTSASQYSSLYATTYRETLGAVRIARFVAKPFCRTYMEAVGSYRNRGFPNP